MQKWRGHDSVGLFWACGKCSHASSNQPSFTLQSTHMGCTGVPCFTSMEEQVFPWSVFGLLLPSSHTPWFSLMLMRFSYPHMVHAVMNLIWFIIWKEKKKTFSSEIQGTNLPLELLIRPNTWDADPFSAEPISIQSHPGVPCFESRI